MLEEVGAARVPAIEVFNKCDRLDDGERARLEALYPGRCACRRCTGEGRDEVIAAMETKLALDTATVTFEFDPQDAFDRERIADLYRFGHVILRHVASDDRRSRSKPSCPRRLLERFHESRRSMRAS